MWRHTVAVALTLSGCNCESLIRYAVTVQVNHENGGLVEGLEATYRLDDGPEEPCTASDHKVTCGISPGRYEIFVDGIGVDGERVEVEARSGRCGVELEEVAVVLQAVDCTDEEVPSVEVAVTAEDRSLLDELVVTWSNDTVADAPCTPLGEVWWCADEVHGDIVVTARSPLASAEATVTVGRDDCHVITEQVTLDLDP